MVTDSIYLLTALLIHISLITAGLSVKKHYEIVYRLALAHLPAIMFCVITAIISLFDYDILSKIFLGMALILTALGLFKSWSFINRYFREIDRANLKK